MLGCGHWMLAPARRKVSHVLGAGVVAGTMAGLAAGVIDALWSWRGAGQFVPGFASHLRFVAFTGLLHGAAGALAGLVVAAGLLLLVRGSRLGDLFQFAAREHRVRRARDPRQVLAGLSIALVAIPVVALCLYAAYRLALPYLATRKVPRLVVVVAMAAGLAAVAVAIPLVAVLARQVERGLVALARRSDRLAQPLSSPVAPAVAAGAWIAIALAAWLVRDWETARVLPLRGPAVLAIAALLARPAWGAANLVIAWLARQRPLVWRSTWPALALGLLALVLATGGSTGVVKATAGYTGLGGPIARTLRRAADWDRDGYARFLGGGDCDDSDPLVHPGAPEIPDDGIDQNCVGGDPSTKASLADGAFAPVPPAVPAGFRVLFITVDTIRRDHVSAYGYARKTTPNLDALAASGTLFEHAWAHAPSTRYSIPAILTGRLPLDVPYDTGVDGWPGIAASATTIAEALQPLGFTATGAITNYWYFDRSRHMDQGITEYDNENARLHAGVAGAGPEQTKGSSSKEQTDKAIAFVERHLADRWFLWVHYYDPHFAYEPHAESPGFGSDRMALYDGELAFTDQHIGRLLEALRAKGLADQTVVVVTGDHGEGFGEHGIDLHGYHLYAAQTAVPMIVKVPGLAPRRSTTPAGHVDLLPTLVNLAGGTATPAMMGASLVPALVGTDRDRTVFQQLSYEGNHELRGGADRTCHVIYNVSPDNSWEVYRTDRDPDEQQDLASDPEICATTRTAIERWYDREAVPAGAMEALLPARPVIATPLDADLGPQVRLLAVEVPAQALRGQPITVTWTFEARAAGPAGWKVFAHLDGPKGAFVNGDHKPPRPFAWWRAGQFVRYTTTLVVPRTAAPGRYTLSVGLFKDSARATVTAPRANVVGNAVAAATIEVMP